jgi:hypothetical protein
LANALGEYEIAFENQEELAGWQMRAYKIIFNRTEKGEELHELRATDAEGRVLKVERDSRGLFDELRHDSVTYPVSMKLTFQEPLWRCEPKGDVYMALWKEPRAGSEQNVVWLPKGELFQVSQRARGDDGVLYLKLADGRGWAIEQTPGEPAVCVRQDGWRKKGPVLSAGPDAFPARVADASWVYAEDEPGKPGWISRPGMPDGQISFDVGTNLGEVIVEYLTAHTDIGTATCNVDGGPPVTLDGRIDEKVSVGEFRKIEAPAGGVHKLTCVSSGRKFKLLSVLAC